MIYLSASASELIQTFELAARLQGSSQDSEESAQAYARAQDAKSNLTTFITILERARSQQAAELAVLRQALKIATTTRSSK